MASGRTKQSREFDDQVLIEEKAHARILTLNRPRQLNALSIHMISRLRMAFNAYEEDPNVSLIILKGKGRAFCAGGDVAAVVHYINDGYWGFGVKFFWNEFTLNYIMATYKKPQVSILNGIVMGGGAGASMHGIFRVVTENSVFAMPETALGLFPDVGASYFLSRLPGFFGEYIGLTGARLDGAEMLTCGLATHFVLSEKLPPLEEALLKVNTADPLVTRAVLDQYSRHVKLKGESALHRMDIIDWCFSRRTVEEILSALEQEAEKGVSDLITSSIHALKKASPTSLKITLRAIREGRLRSIDQCLITDYRVCCHILRREFSHDFFEGCRAILVDKDRNPKWEPSKLELISDGMVDNYFSKVDDDEWEDLKLPYRPTRTARL